MSPSGFFLFQKQNSPKNSPKKEKIRKNKKLLIPPEIFQKNFERHFIIYFEQFDWRYKIINFSKNLTEGKEKVYPLLKKLKFIDAIWIFFCFSFIFSGFQNKKNHLTKVIPPLKKKMILRKNNFFIQKFLPLPLEIYDFHKKTKDVIFISCLFSKKDKPIGFIFLIQKKISIISNFFISPEPLEKNLDFSKILYFSRNSMFEKKYFLENFTFLGNFLKTNWLFKKTKKGFLEKKTGNKKNSQLQSFSNFLKPSPVVFFFPPKKGYLSYKKGIFHFLFLRSKVFYYVKISGTKIFNQKNQIKRCKFSRKNFIKKNLYLLYNRVFCHLNDFIIRNTCAPKSQYHLAYCSMNLIKKDPNQKNLIFPVNRFSYEEFFFIMNSLISSAPLFKNIILGTNDLITFRMLAFEVEIRENWNLEISKSVFLMAFKRFFHFLRQFPGLKFYERERILQRIFLKKSWATTPLTLFKFYFNESFFEALLWAFSLKKNLEGLFLHFKFSEILEFTEDLLSWCLSLVTGAVREVIISDFFYKNLKKVDFRKDSFRIFSANPN